MSMVDKIWHFIKTKAKLFIACALVLPLCACKDPCPTIQDFLHEGIGESFEAFKCLLCPMFKVLIEASKEVAEASWRILAPKLIPVVGVVAAVYIAIFTLKLVGSFGKQTANDYMSDDKRGLLVFMFKTAVIIFLLSGTANGSYFEIGKEILGLGTANKNFLIESIISPLLQSGLEIGQGVAVRTGNNLSFDFYSTDFFGGLSQNIKDNLSSPWAPVFEMIKKAVYGFQAVTYEPVAVGQAMLCGSTLGSIFKWYWLMLAYGFILFVFGWLLTLGVGFYIIDVLIDLMFAASLLPIGVACAISDKTISYTKKIWGIFVNVFFNFVILGIILGMTMRVIDLCMGRAVVEAADASSVAKSVGTSMAMLLSDYQKKFDGSEIKALSEALWSSGSFILTVVCMSVMTVLVGQMKELSSKISGGTSMSSVGSKASAKISQSAIQAGKYASAQSYKRALKPAGNRFAKMTRADKLAKWGQNKYTAAKGFLTGRGAQGYKAWWR